jgi:hypothetical protein
MRFHLHLIRRKGNTQYSGLSLNFPLFFEPSVRKNDPHIRILIAFPRIDGIK